MRKNYKPLIMGILCALIVVMAIGFALLQQELTITGTSSIDSNWNIRITNIRVKNLHSGYASGSNAAADVSGSTGCTTQTAPCSTTSANFEAKLVTPGDYIVYEVTVTNSGTLDGVVSGITLSPTTTDSDAIQVEKSGLAEGDKIAKTNGTNTIDVTVTYNSATSQQPSSTTTNITLTINYQQDLSASQSGQGGNNQSGNSGSATAFDSTTGTGTIYRYYSGSESGSIESLYIEDSVENVMNDTSYGISTDPSAFNSINYLKHEVQNWNVTASYVCFIVNNTEHCMQGGNSSYYTTNKGILSQNENWFNSNSGSCTIDEANYDEWDDETGGPIGEPSYYYSDCDGAGFGSVDATSDGLVSANASGVDCFVGDDGDSNCSRY